MRAVIVTVAFALALVCLVACVLLLLQPFWSAPPLPNLRPPPPPWPSPAPEPSPSPCPPDRPCPRPRPRPTYLPTLVPAGEIRVGGPIAPDGRTQVQCDLPLSLRLKNVGGSDGLGLCVFSSICMASRFQNERRLWDFQEKMRREPGGGWPEKVDQMIAKYGQGTQYLQYEGKDPTILVAALASGRMPSITYCGRDPHYHGRDVAHMVNLVYLDAGQAAVLDNNFVGDNELVWLSAAELVERWTAGGGGWAVFLLAPAPPPVPRLT